MIACSPRESRTDQTVTLGGSDAGGSGEGGGDWSGDCPDGEYPWQDDGQFVCADPAAPDDGEDDNYDPGMPDPDEIADVKCITKITLGASTNCPQIKPTLYKSVLKLFKFDIRVKGVKIGEHSTSRVYRYRWDWDADAKAYKEPVLDAETDHSNHWNKADDRLRFYGMLDSTRTDVTGQGFKAYVATANTYCPCNDDTGHKTEWDSCYVLTGSLFQHVCHNDTRVQIGNFQAAIGKPPMAGDCGQGLSQIYAPTL